MILALAGSALFITLAATAVLGSARNGNELLVKDPHPSILIR